MVNYREILLRHERGESGRSIAQELGISRNTVKKAINAYQEHGSGLSEISGRTASEIVDILFPAAVRMSVRQEPDFNSVHEELLRPGVTLRLLWEEYTSSCERADVPAYRYSRFCELYREYTKTASVTSRIIHTPGNEAMVDWAGKTLALTDPSSGRRKTVYLFVGVLPFSMYSYAEFFVSMDEANRLAAHVHMHEFFGGVPRLLICNNTKRAVLYHGKREDPLLNRVYQEFAEHYGTAILPTRVRRPQDYLQNTVIMKMAPKGRHTAELGAIFCR